MTKKLIFKHLVSALIVFVFIFIAFGSDSDSDSEDKSPEELIADELSNVTFSGSTASFSDNVSPNSLSPQDNYEYSYLIKIYHIIKKGGINKINISITDECKDSYGHVSKRNWHKTLTPEWENWDEVLKYATAGDFAMAYKDYYPISSNTDEGTWYCCGRDPSCN